MIVRGSATRGREGDVAINKPGAEQAGEASPQPKLSGPIGTAAQADEQFSAKVRQLRCPDCGLEFTDAAVDWSDAWWEGRLDLLKALGRDERDGPCKLRCEKCGHRSWLDYFAWEVRSAEGGRA
jgi:uncharacterized C2H2 Zn-finger protein